MRICIQTGRNPYWDQPDEPDNFIDSDDESNASTTTTNTTSNELPARQIINPYTPIPSTRQP